MAMAMAEPMTTNIHPAILPAELADALFAPARIASVDAGQTLFLAGDPCTGCYRLVEGLLKVTLDLGQGRERILAILGPGALVGELSVIDGTPRSACVAAIRASKLQFVSRAVFETSGAPTRKSSTRSQGCWRAGCAISTARWWRRASCPSKAGRPGPC
jgi:CRP-like cAMP-binding protein